MNTGELILVIAAAVGAILAGIDVVKSGGATILTSVGVLIFFVCWVIVAIALRS